ncbi:MAG: OsmC family protein [Armatimonadota bacterium]
MDMTLNYTGGMQFIAKTGNHEITIDLPPTYNGQDTGPAPGDLFAAALGSCVGMYTLMYLKGQSLPTEGLRIDVDWEEKSSPARIDSLHVNISLPDGITPEQARKALKFAEACKIHNTLIHKPEVCVSIAEKPEACLP